MSDPSHVSTITSTRDDNEYLTTTKDYGTILAERILVLVSEEEILERFKGGAETTSQVTHTTTFYYCTIESFFLYAMLP